jgi:arginyl-tRNA synthetase
MGTQFGKLMVAIKQWGNMDDIEKNPIPTLHKLYVQYHMEADKDVELDDEGRAEYKKFEDGDKNSRKLWEKIREWSLKEIQVIYDRLNIDFDYMNGESFYEDKMGPILEAGRKQGIIVEGEKGAWIIQPDDPADTPVLLKKSDGTTLYATRDLARIDYWEKTWHPDLMVNVVDTAQEFHFRQLFFASSKLGLTKAQNVHVSFGRMLGMSTRTGNVLLLTDLLDEAETRALALAKEKGESLNEKEQIALSKIMGVGSIKYSILAPARTTNINFDWNKTLSFEGNSAPYLMYTIARARSVVRKSGFTGGDIEAFDFTPQIDAETQVALDLIAYPSVLERAADEFKPNHLATYLYELAQDFNHFYNGNPVIKAETEALQKSRLLLTAAVVTVMSDGFALLGLEVPERM